MRLRPFIRTAFPVALATIGVSSVETELLAHGYVVVRHGDDILGILTPEDVVEKGHRLVMDCMREVPPLSAEQDAWQALETMRNGNFRAMPVFHEHRFAGVVTRTDLESVSSEFRTELENAVAARTRDLYAAITDALFVHEIDSDGSPRRFLEVNDRACKHSGYTREELLRLSPVDIDAPDSGVDIRSIVQRVAAGADAIFEQVHMSKDGRRIPVEIHAHAFQLTGRSAIMLLVRDITERKQTEEALQQAHDELEHRVAERTKELTRANEQLRSEITERKRVEDEKEELQAQVNQAQKMEALGTLVAGVAHEINNPISYILFNAPLLRKIWSDFQPVLEGRAAVEPQRKYGGLPYEFLKKNLVSLLEDMELAGNRIAAIVKGLKDFAKKSDMPGKKPLTLNEAVENALRLAQSTLRKSGINVRTKFRRGLPEMQGNLQSIEQVILNLIINAAQAIEHDKGVIELETGFDRRRGHLFVVVRDNGKGIEPGVRGRVFDLFFTTKQSAGGTGLGLAVSYTLVKAHDGNITFKSEVGKGTTFRVSLPCQRRERAARILVVDDEETVRDVVPQQRARPPG